MRGSTDGFSLVEALVALTVLALGAVAFVGTTELHVRRIAELEDRAVAGWVAHNRLAELSAGAAPLVDGEESVSMLNAEWRLRQRVAATDDPDLAEVRLRVFGAAGERSFARLTGFVDRAASP